MPPSREWVLLAYRIPREPSTPRITVWRKLRRLGAVQLLDGLVALPADARTKEHLEWIANDVVEAGGEANIWLARPATKAQDRALVKQMAEAVAGEYSVIVEAATDALSDTPTNRKRATARLRRDLKNIRQRDHFPDRGHQHATAAIDRLAATIAATETEQAVGTR